MIAYFQRLMCISLYVLILATPIYAQELPNPSKLNPEWWNFFETSGFTLQSRITTFEKEIDKSLIKISEENRVRAEAIIDEIKTNLKAYRTATNLPPPTPIVPRTVSTRYTINTVMDLYHKIRQSEKKIHAMELTKENIKKQLSLVNQNLTRSKAAQEFATSGSEEKYLHGLEVILYQTAAAVHKIKIKNIEKAGSANRETIAFLNEELEIAELLITSTPSEQNAFQKQMTTFAEELSHALEQLRQWEEQASKLSGDTADFGERVQKLYLESQLLEARVDEALARDKYLQTQLLYHLSHLVNNPESFDLDYLEANIPNWRSILEEFSKKGTVWDEQALLMQDAVVRLFSQAENKKSLSPEIIKKSDDINTLTQHITTLDQRFLTEVDDNTYLLEILNNRINSFKSEKTNWYKNFWKKGVSFKTNVSKGMNEPIVTIGSLPINTWDIIRSLTVFGVTLLFAITFNRWLIHTLDRRRKVEKSVGKRVRLIIWYTILTIGTTFALSALGFNLTTLYIMLSAVVIALGVALKDLINNFISGIVLLFEASVKVGDYIQLDSGLSGEIRAIYLLSTRILTNDGTYALVPNAQMVTRTLQNWTYKEPYRRFLIDFTVAYGEDKDLVQRVVVEAANGVSTTLKKIGIPEPEVFLSDFEENYLHLQLAVWVNESATRKEVKTRSRYLWAIEEALSKHGIKAAKR